MRSFRERKTTPRLSIAPRVRLQCKKLSSLENETGTKHSELLGVGFSHHVDVLNLLGHRKYRGDLLLLKHRF